MMELMDIKPKPAKPEAPAPAVAPVSAEGPPATPAEAPATSTEATTTPVGAAVPPAKTSAAQAAAIVSEGPTFNDSELLVPGQDDQDGNDDKQDRSINKWHDFESQYSLALEQSVVVEREQWGGQCEFLMSCISSAVGLGNIWRFPLVAGQNGGGAFLVPYLIVLTIIGRPLYMLELGLGQFCSSGPVKIWEMAPAFRGVGIAGFVASFFVSTFYVVIMGWAILYLFYSMYPVFPWNQDTFELSGFSMTPNKSSAKFFGLGHLRAPAKPDNKTDFYLHKGLDGLPDLNQTIALFIGWFLVWGMMVRGVSGSGKVAYFTAIFPYVVLLILLGGGLSLDGSGDGILFFFKPTWAEILKPQTWFQAVGQCFFSLGISFGGVIMFSSFNSFRHRLGRDILIISIMDTFTSVLAGTCLFGLIGNIALTERDKINADITTVIGTNDTTTLAEIIKLTKNPGAGLAFITFPNVLQAFGAYPWPNCIAALFFFMIIVLAVGSANGLVGTTVTVTCDYFPKWKRPYVVTGMACTCFLFGLLYVTPSGNNIIDIVDQHGSELVVYMVAIFEVFGIVSVYGLKNISNDFEFMLGGRINMYWLTCWFMLPIFLVGIFICYLVTYKANEKWPTMALVFAWLLSIGEWLIIPGVAIWVIQTRKSHSLKKRTKAAFLPTRKWGPKDPAVREAWRRWKKTKPTEFPTTARILTFLRIRAYVPPTDLQAYWSNDMESQYQTTSNSVAPSHTVVTPGVEVADENIQHPAPPPQEAH